MEAPSAGSDLIDITGKGHKVVVSGKTDVWYKIEWQGKDGYIKAKNVKLLTVWLNEVGSPKTEVRRINL